LKKLKLTFKICSKKWKTVSSTPTGMKVRGHTLIYAHAGKEGMQRIPNIRKFLELGLRRGGGRVRYGEGEDVF